MNVNEQRPKYRWLGFNPRNLAIVIIIAGILIPYYTITHKSGDSTPPPTIPSEPLQLGKLQAHTYDDMGFAVSYPSDWVELQENGSVTIFCLDLCMDQPLLLALFSPVDISHMDLQSAIDLISTYHIKDTGRTTISNEPIAANGTPLVQVIISDTSLFSYEIWEVFLFIHEDSMLGTMAAYIRADCWDYYKDAVYTITSTYQFLD